MSDYLFSFHHSRQLSVFLPPFYLHGVVKVANLSHCLPRGQAVEAGVVDVADNALDPGQGACRRQGFVWKMTYKRRKRTRRLAWDTEQWNTGSDLKTQTTGSGLTNDPKTQTIYVNKYCVSFIQIIWNYNVIIFKLMWAAFTCQTDLRWELQMEAFSYFLCKSLGKYMQSFYAHRQKYCPLLHLEYIQSA